MSNLSVKEMMALLVSGATLAANSDGSIGVYPKGTAIDYSNCKLSQLLRFDNCGELETIYPQDKYSEWVRVTEQGCDLRLWFCQEK